MQRVQRTALVVAGLLAMSAAPVTIESASAAPSDPPVTGTVFRDYDADGVRDDREPGVAGIGVEVFDSIGGVASATTGADGTYTVDVTGLDGSSFRVEFEIPASMAYLESGAAGGTSVQFAEAGDVVDFAVNNPSDYCQQVATLVTSCFSYGDHDDASSGSNSTVVEYPETASGDISASYDEIAEHLDVGAVWGVAYGQPTTAAPDGTLYLGAFTKRHVGFGPSGTGAIYAVDRNTGAVTTLTTLAAGTDPHPDLPDANLSAPPGRSTDAAAFDAVGKIGLGDVEMSEDGSVLYVVNLADKALHRIDPATGDTLGMSPVPAPGCPGGDADNWRPFALGVQDGVTYVGGVCSGQSDDAATSLQTHVYTWTEAAGAWSTSPVYSLTDMDYLKGDPENYEYTAGGGQTGLFRTDAWRPWTDDFDDYVVDPIAPIATNTGVCVDGDTVDWGLGSGDFYCSHPQPMLADITLDNGDLVLSYMDRYGHQMGTLNASTTTPDPNTNFYAVVAGEILRACGSPATGWTTESNGSCTSASDWPTANNGVATAGAGNVRGPDGGEFYVGSAFNDHEDTTAGGAVQIPGREHVLSVSMDPNRYESGGVILLDNETGDQTAGRYVELYRGGMFAKANGLGDLEALCDQAPVEIGNYVWFDVDRDGVQDPDEGPVAGATVHLYLDADGDGEPDGAALATAVTDADGNYLFLSDEAPNYVASGSIVGDDTDHLGEVTGGLTFGQRYLIRLDEPTDHTGGGVLAGYDPTRDNVGNDAADTIDDGTHRGEPTDRRDSDGTIGSSGYPEVAVVIGQAGQHDHTLDFGFATRYSLGNQVWFDLDDDGAIGSDEAHVPGVVVELFTDEDGNGEPDDRNGDGSITSADAVDSTLTDGSGHYLFDWLEPGDYVVGIPGSEFDVGAPLEGWLSSTPTALDPENDADLDDNGFAGPDGFVVSGPVTIGDGEPTGEDPDNDPHTPDANENLTVDFGFWQPRFDIALRKQLDDGTNEAEVAVGDTVTFVITVFNQGNVAGAGLEIVDYVPVGLELDDADWTLDADGNARYPLTGVVLEPGSSAAVEITFVVTADAATIDNYAEVSSQTAVDQDGNELTWQSGSPILDVDSVPDANDGDELRDDVIDDDGALDEDDHDIASLLVSNGAATPTTVPNAVDDGATTTTTPTPRLPESGAGSTWPTVLLAAGLVLVGLAAVRGSKRRPASV